MTGTFFKDKTIEIPGCCVYNGGCWRPDGKGGARAWDPEHLEFIYNKLVAIENPVFLDIGANTGAVCLLAKHLPCARCVAFEPDPAVHLQLATAICENSLNEQILLGRSALSDKAVSSALLSRTTDEQTGMTRLRFDDRLRPGWMVQDIACYTETMDGFCSGFVHSWNHIDLVCIDVEGAEPLVLKGGQETLKRFHPILILEWVPEFFGHYGFTEKNVEDMLVEIGYNHMEQITATDRCYTKV